jgi:hypothetical protein
MNRRTPTRRLAAPWPFPLSALADQKGLVRNVQPEPALVRRALRLRLPKRKPSP